MDILKFSLLGVAIVFAIVFTKQVKPEFAVLITIAGSIVMLAYILGFFGQIVSVYNSLILRTGVDQGYFTILLKAIAVAYLVEFASGICKDSGNTSISDKIVLAGKVSILILSIPLVETIFDLISDIL